MPYDILLADDSPEDVKLMQLALLEAGVEHNLHVVHDGDQALAFLRKQVPYANAARPDLVILDANMNRMSGHEALDEIKADPELKAIPVVILTTSNDPALVLASYEKYANSHVMKPMGFPELVSKVAEGLKNYWFNVVELPSH
jgi:CheY-like chemotaxis protein